MPIVSSLKAFRGIMFDTFNDGAHEWFRDLEHLGGIDLSFPLLHLPNLKTAYGNFNFLDDEFFDAPDMQEVLFNS